MTNTFTHYGRAATLAALLALPGIGTAQQPAQPKASAVNRGLEYLNARRTKLGLTEADLRNPAVPSEYTDAHNGATHLYLRQRHQGVEIYGAVTEVHFDRNGKVVASHNGFVPNAASHARSTRPALSPEQAVAAAARALNMPAPQGLRLVKEGTATEGMMFSEGGISLEKIPVKLMYFRQPNGELALTWNVTLYPLDAEHYWDARIDASTGQLLDRTDFVVREEASFAALAQRRNAAPAAVAAQRTTTGGTQPAPPVASRTNAPNSYNVWPLTVESPIHGNRQLITDPAHPWASPYGWHDTNGLRGAEYTITRGNNVHAYEDRRSLNNGNTSNNYTPGYSPNGGASLIFDFPYQTGVAASVNQDAAITNLFVWNNLMHDVMNQHGFTEGARNFQMYNYSGAGIGNDFVQAEAQDGRGVSNANMATPPDGFQPRMQMYLWDTDQRSLIAELANGSTLGSFNFATSAFGRRLGLVSPVAGQLVYAADGCANPMPNASALNGKVALIKRGNCNLAPKVRNAQNAGARMVIVMDSLANSPLISMSGSAADTAGIRIPSVFISRANGQQLLSALAAGSVNITVTALDRDGDFDNGIIAHEYGHGISNRLTGVGSGCLSNAEQMGEGWSDFFALWMTTKPGDKGETPRGIGNFAVGEPVTGGGIRTKPYSTSLSVNDLSYANLGTAPYTAVHANGEIWCAALWDLNWALIEKHGYNADLYGETGGNNIALKLVIEGLKYQGCSPGFISGRNGILKADSVNNNAANAAIIWKVFARRGMGADASQGSPDVLNDGKPSFTLPTAVLSSNKPKFSTDELAVFPNPANEEVTVRMLAASQQPVAVELLNHLGQVVQRTTQSAALLQREGAKLSTANLPAGMYVIRLTGSNGTATHKLVVRH
ncbi:T9SS C-terminal target domain-containing protein [Hymenobacter oligotrophus]|uniref:T9SS C-terminal target domain-containing protein n=1 Tax=Hymenobacter oligotrophus TaxID=2319843 RepID=A0A3B7R2G2_9BACT|nr:T9SS-dependent M36 family metallopeptidase [Hymenobacter oligotrophus]AYA37510.1 T9SS C-terminal target domain-containing protein [Hymenobacter oligotrophus]